MTAVLAIASTAVLHLACSESDKQDKLRRAAERCQQEDTELPF
jgi:hypothetical protein